MSPSETGRIKLKRFLQRPLSSAFAREGALYAARIVERLRLHQRLLDRDGIRDPDVFSLLGLELNDRQEEKVTIGDVRDAVSKQLRRLERCVNLRPDSLSANIDKIGEVLKLDSTERAVLRLSVITTKVRYFDDLMKLSLTTPSELMRAVARAMGLRVARVHQALAENETLRRSGFFENHDLRINGTNPLEVDPSVADALLARQFDESRFLRRLVRKGQVSTLTLDDFTHIADLDVMSRYLGNIASNERIGVNILLYGAPGTGKTEFVRALAPALDLDLYEVPNQDATGDPISGRRRFSAYTVCQNLLATRQRQLLLFDEVEDVFGSGNASSGSLFSMFGSRHMRDPDELRKSWVNETLESNKVPAIWVCNSIDAMDPAFLRRFDLVVEFRSPSRSVRRRIVDRYFEQGDVTTACAERMAEFEHLPPAQVARAARVVRSLRTRDINKRSEEVERILEASMRAMGHRKPMLSPAWDDHYDPAFLNTDRDLMQLCRGLADKHGARICLYGPPGTGKTAFAHHLGRELDRPVLVKRGSDLLSMYLGDTEAKIAQAFRQARDDNAILLFDEADGFLRDRATAQRPWEITQVNELLTQIEAFNGIFVASTNLVDTLDSASLRRFDFKIKFGYLNRSQRREFLSRVVCDMRMKNADIDKSLGALDHLDALTPGDFANVSRQLRVTDCPATAVHFIELLGQEARMKPEGRQRRIGFIA